MSSADFFASSKVLIVAGKGGVGKTTVGASLSIAAATAGFDVLLIELEGHSNLGASFGRETLTYEETVLLETGSKIRRAAGFGEQSSARTTVVKGRVRGRRITPDGALDDYLNSSDVGRLAARLASSGIVELVATAAPGIRDVLALGKIRQLEQNGEADLIIVDGPAAGHAVSFLLSATGLRDIVTTGPVRQQADQVLEMLADPSRCQATLVTLAEETPVTELIDTAFQLEEDVNISLTPTIINNVIDSSSLEDKELAGALNLARTQRQTQKQKSLIAAAEFTVSKSQRQRKQIRRLDKELPLDQLVLPTIFSARLQIGELATLAEAVTAQLDEMS